MATDLTAHQTKGARDIAWLYGGGSRSGGGSGGGGKSGKKRPDWIENPPEGFIVGRGQSQTMSMAQSKARSDAERLLLKQHGVDSANTSGLSTAKNFRDPETGEWYTLFDARNVTVTPLPAEAAPERPQEPVADAPLALDDYEQPTLDPVDLDLELGEEEDEEELAIEPAIREPALDYALDEEDEEEAPSLEDQIVETTRFRESPDISIAGSTPAVNPMEQFRDVYGFGFEDATAPRFPVSPDVSITGSTPAPDATQLMRRSAEAGGAATPPATTAVDISAAGGVPALMNEEDRERRFAEIQGDRIEEAPQFDVGRDISITGSEDMAKLPEDAGPGLLDRLAGMGGKIGQLVRDNPDLVLQGLRTIGELGGEYKRGRREQEAADRMAQEARMGTAISALTRGRVNPTVAPRMPRTSAGEGMFDVLAGIGRGGQEFMGQKRALEEREEAMDIYREERDWERGQAEQERKDELEARLEASRLSAAEKEEERRRWEREQGREDRKLDIQEEENALKRVPKLDTSDLDPEMAKVVADGINELIRLFESGGPTETGTMSYEQSYGEGASHQAEFDRVKKGLTGRMKEFYDLGRLSDRDYQIIIDALPDRNRSSGYNRGVRRGIFSSLQIASQGRWQNPYDPQNKKLGTTAAARPTAMEEVEEVPKSAEALIDQALDDDGNIVDEEAFEEARRLGYI